MHELVERIREPELCYVFARNAQRQGHPELAVQAFRRAVDLRTEAYGATDAAEVAAVRAIFAYEEAISQQRGRRTRATGTWQLAKRVGLLAAVRKRSEARDSEEVLPVLRALQMEDYSFAAVCSAFPEETARAA
ncbi:hypothetical protein E4634_03940 [Mangrovimicrobium sediminis]|uniref:Tetratricopeptide repeat protein n=1 Tax=Mangrovimicrobium sediminis TaxID=2562682 RepID=A0A4Z0M658_9GAMM|nr:hypothetical protein [Haliea sp. SAOS-164]TGD75163.1 hypothetical protein E4634_03940 [Haliea sp. SAOS-164]